MKSFERITIDPTVMGGGVKRAFAACASRSGRSWVSCQPVTHLPKSLKPIRILNGRTSTYAAWRLEEREIPLSTS